MNRKQETQIKSIFDKHIQEALDEINEAKIDLGLFGENITEHLAEILTRAMMIQCETGCAQQ